MTVDRPAFQEWLDRYVAAWNSYHPAAIGALFSEDATYRYHPADEPVIGRAAIEGDDHVASGRSRYFTAAGDLRDEYWNVYLVRFDAIGQATEFTEVDRGTGRPHDAIDRQRWTRRSPRRSWRRMLTSTPEAPALPCRS